MKRYLWLLLPILLIGCAIQSVTEPRRTNFANEPTPLPARDSAEKITYTVERGLIKEQLNLPGRVGSAIEAPLEARRDGIVSAILVQEGAALVAGDIIALLDSADIEEQLAATRTQLTFTEGRLVLKRDLLNNETTAANLQLERANLQLTAAQARDAAETELRVFRIDIELAQLALDQISTSPDPALQQEIIDLQEQIAALEQQRNEKQLLALADGDLVGLTVQTGSRARGGTTIGLLVDFAQPVVWAEANGGALALLAEGGDVTLALPSIPDETFSGTIERLPLPHGRGTVRDGALQIVAPNLPDYGERIDVAITLAEKDDALWIPPAALREFAGQPFVIVQEGDDERRADVEVGIVTVGRIEITDGLQEGEIVVAP